MTAIINENTLTVYADGSSLSHPRRGGIGLIFVYVGSDGNEVSEPQDIPGYKSATNNQMELSACIEGLKRAVKHPMLGKHRKLIMRTDSKYVSDYHSYALSSWPSAHWCNKQGRPIENAELWKEYRKIYTKLRNNLRIWISIEWVKGHEEDFYNKWADKLAKASAKGILKGPLFIAKVRKKTTPGMINIGSVGILGQKISIRIITSQYLPLQKTDYATFFL